MYFLADRNHYTRQKVGFNQLALCGLLRVHVALNHFALCALRIPVIDNAGVRFDFPRGSTLQFFCWRR